MGGGLGITRSASFCSDEWPVPGIGVLESSWRNNGASRARLRHLRYLVHLEGQREGTVPKCRGCQQRSTSGASCSSRGWLPWPSTSSCTSATGCPGRRRLSSAYPLLVVSRFLRLLVSHFLRHLLSPLPTHLPSRPPIHLLGLRLSSRHRLLSSSSIYDKDTRADTSGLVRSARTH